MSESAAGRSERGFTERDPRVSPQFPAWWMVVSPEERRIKKARLMALNIVKREKRLKMMVSTLKRPVKV